MLDRSVSPSLFLHLKIFVTLSQPLSDNKTSRLGNLVLADNVSTNSFPHQAFAFGSLLFVVMASPNSRKTQQRTCWFSHPAQRDDLQPPGRGVLHRSPRGTVNALVRSCKTSLKYVYICRQDRFRAVVCQLDAFRPCRICVSLWTESTFPSRMTVPRYKPRKTETRLSGKQTNSTVCRIAF